MACPFGGGSWSSTIPFRLGSFVSWGTTFTLKPDCLRIEEAVFWSSVVTSGTAVVFGPFDTVSVTVEPLGANVLPFGSWSVTVPEGSFESLSTRSTRKPFAWSSELACAKGMPTTGGTATGAGPLETLIRTFEPFTTFTPGPGACATTVPGSLSEYTSWASGLSPTDAIAAAASVELSPRTSGTRTFAAPVETKIVTELPLGVLFPCDGSWSNTNVGGCAVDGRRTMWALRPAPTIWSRAIASRLP